jgi:uncharacterized protein (DUF2141 family)
MLKSIRPAANAASAFIVAAALFAGLVLAAPLAAQPQVLGTDTAACLAGAGGQAALVRVSGFKDRVGRLRLQFYSDDPKTFLASGTYIRRQEVAMTPAGDMVLCIAVPVPGDYAFVVLHDRDSDGRLSIWSDGVGFSNNPRLALAKPKVGPMLVHIADGVTPIPIVMNYRRGLSVGPLPAK